MNFREHIFIALCTQQRTIHAPSFLRDAQKIADMCCVEWGHEFTATTRNRIQRCKRCGRGMMDVNTVVEDVEDMPAPKPVKLPVPRLPPGKRVVFSSGGRRS
jgi:hypothetical protein